MSCTLSPRAPKRVKETVAGGGLASAAAKSSTFRDCGIAAKRSTRPIRQRKLGPVGQSGYPASTAVTIRQADEHQAYTLSDAATFWQLEHRLRVTAFFGDDPRLVNSYAVVFPANNPAAAAFGEWLTRGDGRERMGTLSRSRARRLYRLAGRMPIHRAGCATLHRRAQRCGALKADTPALADTLQARF